jgi:hypothetical protein
MASSGASSSSSSDTSTSVDADFVVDIIPVNPSDAPPENSENLCENCGCWCNDCLFYCCNDNLPTSLNGALSRLQKARACFNFWKYVVTLFPLIGGFIGTVFGVLFIWLPDEKSLGYTETVITGLITLVIGVSIHLQHIFLAEIQNFSNEPYVKGKFEVYAGKTLLNPLNTQVIVGPGMITTAGDGTTRTATVTGQGAIPFLTSDKDYTQVQTPNGIFPISNFISTSQVNITTSPTYVNEANVGYCLRRTQQ